MSVRINVNEASVDELKTLPGVGHKTADSIVAYRTNVGWLNEDSFKAIPYIRVSAQLLQLVDFTIPDQYRQREEIDRVSVAIDESVRRRSPLHYRGLSSSDWQMPPVQSDEYSTRRSPYRMEEPSYPDEADRYFRSAAGYRDHEREERYRHQRYDAHPAERMGRLEPSRRYWSEIPPGRVSRPDVKKEYQSKDEREDGYQPNPQPKKEERKDTNASKRLGSIPRTLIYNGKSSWKSFFTKFTKYAESLGWSARECKDGLCMCLDEKASDFYATHIADQCEVLEYFDIVKKFEKRFGFQELPETATIAFNTAHQKPDEGLDDWADRIVELAMKAYRDLPEEYAYKQAILRFCLGCTNKEAGEAAANKRPTSMGEAIDSVKWAIHTHSAIHGRRREVRQVIGDGIQYDRESDPAVCAVREEPKLNIKPVLSKLESTVDGLKTRMSKLEGRHTEIDDKLERILALLTVRSRSMSPRRPGSTPEAAQRRKLECFHCKGEHFLRDCPEKEKREGKKVQFVEGAAATEEEDLNEEGLDD